MKVLINWNFVYFWSDPYQNETDPEHFCLTQYLCSGGREAKDWAGVNLHNSGSETQDVLLPGMAGPFIHSLLIFYPDPANTDQR